MKYVKLMDVAIVNPKLNKKEINLDVDVSFIPMACVSDTTFSIINEKTRVASQVIKGFTHFKRNDVLLAKITPCFENGKIAIAKILKNNGFGTTEFHVIRVNPDVLDEKYIYYFMRQPSFIKDGALHMTGSAGQKRVPKHFLENLEIPLPPLETQKKIAAILDKADELRRQRKTAIKKLDDLTQSVFLDMFGDPVTNPKEYLINKVGDVCNIKGGKRVPKGKQLIKKDTGFPYIKAGNIKNGKVTIKNLEYLTTELRDKLKNYTVNKGDVCITVVGVNIGDVGIVPPSLHQANLTENANKILIKDRILIENIYLAHYLQSDFVKKQILKKTMAVGVPKLALFRIQQLDILIPPIILQNEFAAIIEKIEKEKEIMQQSLEKLDNNFNSLMQRAFKGELNLKLIENNNKVGR